MGIYLIGDMHGDWRKFQIICSDLTENDILIQLGDHGLDYYPNNDTRIKEKFSKVKARCIFLRGNHDRSIHKVNKYKKIDVDDGIIKGSFYYDPEYPNLLMCDMITSFSIKDKTFLAISGAYSIDKYYRLRNGWEYFEDEQICLEDMNLFKRKIESGKEQSKYDIILSHTCPIRFEPTHLFLPYVNQNTVDKSTEKFLNWIELNLDYTQWFCGHFHSHEKLWDRGMMLYDYQLYELEF